MLDPFSGVTRYFCMLLFHTSFAFYNSFLDLGGNRVEFL